MKCQKCKASQCNNKDFYFIATVIFATLCNLQNQSFYAVYFIKLHISSAFIVLAAKNNFFILFTDIVFVHALCIVRSATFKFCIPKYLVH